MHKFQSYPSDTRRNNNHDVEAFWRKNDVIIKSCARWDFFITCSQSALKTKPGFLITRSFCLFVCLFVFARCCSPCYHHYILYTCLINKYERFCHTTMPWIKLLFRNFASLNIVGFFLASRLQWQLCCFLRLDEVGLSSVESLSGKRVDNNNLHWLPVLVPCIKSVLVFWMVCLP